MEHVDRGDLDRILVMLAELDGSDLHIKAGAPPRIRVAGSLRTLDDEPSFTAAETLDLAESIMTPAILEVFKEHHEADFAYSLAGTGRFRVNAYYQRSSVALAMRRVRSSLRHGRRARTSRRGQPTGRGDAWPGPGYRSHRIG